MLARTISILMAVFLSAAFCAAQSPNATKLESELRVALHDRWAALARHDAAAYGSFLDDDILIPDNGLLYDKKALIERARSLGESSNEPREVRVHGDEHAAVMIYRTTSRTPFAGVELTQELRILESYVKRNGRWLLTARAESDIPNANRVAAKIDPAALDAFVGEYEISPGKVVKITRDGDHLMELEPDDPTPEADWPMSADSFFQREQPGVLMFTRGADGKVESYVLWIYDSTVVGKKIR